MLEQLVQDYHASAILLGYHHHTSIAELARRHDVSEALIRAVVDGRRYGHVTGRWHPRPEDRDLSSARPDCGVGSASWPS